MAQSYRVSIEAAGVGARPAWADLVKQDQSIPLSKTPQWADCICSCDHFSDATLLFRGEDGRRLIVPRLRNPSLPGILRHLPAIGISVLMQAVSSVKEGHPHAERPVR